MAKDTYYFSHDYNARSDSKIKLLLRKVGVLGYGVYWCIVEDLYNNANALPLDCEGIAYELHVDELIVKSVIHDFELFVIAKNKVSSNSVQRRLDERNSKSIKASTSAKKRWDDANAMRTHSDGNAIKEKKGNKRKEIKEKKESSEFETFWELYGKKVDKSKCETKWGNLKPNDIQRIFETLPAYIKSTPEIQYRKNPATYLNNKCWNDEPPISDGVDRRKHPSFPVGYPYTTENIYFYEKGLTQKMKTA